MLTIMKLTVLVDNNTLIDRYFLSEPALSFFIEDEGTSVLFDTGYSEVFLHNSAKLGIDPLAADYLVLSHGHIDHTGGLDSLLKRGVERRLENRKSPLPHLVAHPAALLPKLLDMALPVGITVTRDAWVSMMDITESREPFRLTERILFLGEIERTFDFESSEPIGIRRDPSGDVPDYMIDDTALVYESDKGLVIISGCSHSGICNIVEQARILTGEERVFDIIGGFHLLDPSPQRLEGTAKYLSTLSLPCLSACHCTDLRSKLYLSKVAPLREVGSGLKIEY
jgi:7,8-dihydropterin-6-yl-methyl-4-(beta-D-ribofuranosyl)aminobenzene 5'-phosphate synthase